MPGPNPTASAEIAPTETPALFRAAVLRAASLLRSGQLVALPTETVYGLAANALDSAAVEKIFAAKNRPAHNPIIVHVASLEMARRCAADWPPVADALARAFWPGPLTLVFPRASIIPPAVTAGGATVGIRWPSHPFIQAVIKECNFPLAAPSANSSNQISPTNAGHVANDLGLRIPLIVDGGQCQVGIESTVLDLTVKPPRILRPGMIHAASLNAALPDSVDSISAAPDESLAAPLRSPGQLPRHYAPRAKLLLLSWTSDADLRSQLASQLSGIHVLAHSVIPSSEGFAGVSVIPHDAEAFARALYSELHRCDASGARVIVVEAPPSGPLWLAVADRLHRASS